MKASWWTWDAAGAPCIRWLRGARRIIGLDNAIEIRPDVVASVTALPLASGSIDGIVCTSVLEHVPEVGQALREFRRVLRPTGRMYREVPQSWGLHREPYDYWRFTKYGIR